MNTRISFLESSLLPVFLAITSSVSAQIVDPSDAKCIVRDRSDSKKWAVLI